MNYGIRSVTVKMQQAMFAQIKTMAEKRGESLSEMIRFLIRRGMEERIYEENRELLAEVVREQIESVLDSYTVYPAENYHGRSRKMTGKVFEGRIALCRPPKDGLAG